MKNSELHQKIKYFPFELRIIMKDKHISESYVILADYYGNLRNFGMQKIKANVSLTYLWSVNVSRSRDQNLKVFWCEACSLKL